MFKYHLDDDYASEGSWLFWRLCGRNSSAISDTSKNTLFTRNEDLVSVHSAAY
jgi:hypothetical protein